MSREKKFFVLVNKQGLPYVSLRRGNPDEPLVGICSDLESARGLMKAFLESKKSTK